MIRKLTIENVGWAFYQIAPYSVWITKIELDLLQLLTIDDASGERARVPIILDGDNFIFGEPIPTKRYSHGGMR
jgi:hypothetical protein